MEVCLGVGLLALATRYVRSSFLQTISICDYTVASALVVSVLMTYFVRIWLYPLWKVNKLDREKSYAAACSAEDTLLGANVQPTVKTNQEIDVSFGTFARD